MAHQPVTELWIHHQGGGAVIQVRSVEPAEPAMGEPWLRMGVASVIAGVIMTTLGSFVMGPVVALGGAGAIWMFRRNSRRAALALPAAGGASEPKVSAQVRAERSRRVLGSLEVDGPCTFEALLARLRWTEPALLETLIQLKNDGRIDEDLDLDSGQWIYRPMGRHGAGGSLTLDERHSRMQLENE